MFGSRKGYQARPPPPPRQRKPAAAPPPRKQLFAFDPVAAHYNALNHERRHGVTQPVVCVDLNAANELRRWRETGDLTEAAATIKALVPEAANEGELLERALAAHLRRRATPSIRCWDLVKARLAFQRIDCCVYCGESTRTEDEAVAVPELQAARGLRGRGAPAVPGAGGRRAPVHEMDVWCMFGGSKEAVRADARRQIDRRRPGGGGRGGRGAARVGNHAVDGAGLGRAACTTGRPEESARRAAAAHGPVWTIQLHAIASMAWGA